MSAWADGQCVIGTEEIVTRSLGSVSVLRLQIRGDAPTGNTGLKGRQSSDTGGPARFGSAEAVRAYCVDAPTGNPGLKGRQKKDGLGFRSPH